MNIATGLLRLVHTLGVLPAALYVLQRTCARLLRHRRHAFYLRTKEAKYPLLCRASSSDIQVFHQVFIRREYAILETIPALKDRSKVRLIIDCGANVGYASCFFLSRFPCCRLIAVEPDASNFTLLQGNLAPFGSRVRCTKSAVWSRPARMAMTEATCGNGQEWGRQVRECRDGERSFFTATDIPTLLRESGEPRVSLLKMDIEGAEAVVFSGQCAWLDLVDTIVVELHDDTDFGNATEAFKSACNERFNFINFGELTIATRPRS